MPPWRLALAILCLPSLAQAAPDPSCTAAAVNKQRAEAEKLVKSGDVHGALDHLADLFDRCGNDLEREPKLWLISDMAFAAYKAGDLERCRKIFNEVDDDAATAFPKASKALLYNANLCAPREEYCDYKLDHDEPVCRMKLALEYARRNELTGFVAKKCPIAGHADGTAILPAAGAKAACIELGEYVRKEDYAADCPAVFLVEDRGAGKPSRQKLAEGKGGVGWIAETSDCCSVGNPTVRTTNGKNELLFSSGGLARDCFGGTAAVDHMTTYELRGTTLEMTGDYDIGWH